MDLKGSAGLWRPRGSLAPASSDGALPAASTTALRGPSAGSPFRDDLRGAFSALRARPARSGRGADVFGLPRQAPCGAFRNSPAVAAAARVGRHRAPAAGPPPLRLHDPVRPRLLARGERRQITMAGNRCQGLFSRIFPSRKPATLTAVMAGLRPAPPPLPSPPARFGGEN